MIPASCDECGSPATHVATLVDEEKEVCEDCAMGLHEWGYDVREKEEGEP